MRQQLWVAAGLSSILAGFPCHVAAQAVATEHASHAWLARYRPLADSLIAAATRDSAAYLRLGRLVDTFGPRLSGSASLEAAIDWILAEMKNDGLNGVRGERVMVPRWVRGAESATLVQPRRMQLRLLGLGGSVATSASGVSAPVLVVNSFEELQSRAAEARGKIVLYDAPFTSYRETVRYRVEGASAAARVGAVASLVRSIAHFSIRSPHTGVMRYDSTGLRIPAAAVSVEDAQMLHRMQARGDRLVLHLVLRNQTLPDAPSRNVVAEIRGRELPDEVVVVGGHIDSWDVGQGAVDDGGGSVAAWEAVRLIRRLGLHPRRTIRVVLWTNEENGGRGALAYRDTHAGELEWHIAAMESDNGTFNPRGFRYSGPASGLEIVRRIGALLDGIHAGQVEQETESPEADIAPLVEQGVPGLGLEVEPSRYFWFHHSDGDTLDKVNPAELGRCVAALAVMAFVLADQPDGLRPVSR